MDMEFWKNFTLEIKTKPKTDLETVKIFFTVYIRGLQGFALKINIDQMLNLKDEDLLKWMTDNKDDIVLSLSSIKIWFFFCLCIDMSL